MMHEEMKCVAPFLDCAMICPVCDAVLRICVYHCGVELLEW